MEPPESKRKYRSTWRRLVCLIDRYGHQATFDPRRQPQSPEGTVITLTTLVVVIVLLVLVVVRFSYREETTRVGGRAPLNGLYIYTPSSGPRKQTWPHVFVPSLTLKLGTKLIFFQRPEDRRAVHKIEVVDRNGYQETYTSDTSDTPVGYGEYSNHEVPLNSFDGRVSEAVQPQSQGLRFGLQEDVHFSEVIEATESMAILRRLNRGTAQRGADFVDHKAETFMRLRPRELATLKKCQLQILLYNEGQFRALADNELMYRTDFHGKDVFNGQSSNPITWHPDSFGEDGAWRFSVLDLVNTSAALTSAMLEEFLSKEGSNGEFGKDRNLERGDYMAWGFVYNFVNNFNYTVQEPLCAGLPTFRAQWVRGVSHGRLQADGLVLPGERSWPFPPFSLVVQGQGVTERMVVTEVRTVRRADNSTEQELAVTRTRDSIDGASLLGNVSALARPPTPGSGWVCPYAWYGNGVCNCECGGADVDCFMRGNVAETGCESVEAFGTLCTHEGRCAGNSYTYDLTVSEGCPLGKLYIPGEALRVGFQGDDELYRRAAAAPGDGGCSQCPLEQVFRGVPQRHGPKQSLTCSPPVRAQVHADLNSQDGPPWGVVTPRTNASGLPRVTLRVLMQPGFAFPDPRANDAFAAGGFPAEVTVGCCSRRERVRVVAAEPLGSGLHRVELVPERGAGLENTVTFSEADFVFGETSGRLCRYGLVAELVSPIGLDTRIIEVMLPINSEGILDAATSLFFPRVPRESFTYEVRLQGRTVAITEASRVRVVEWTGQRRLVQTLFLHHAPRFSIGGRSYAVGGARAGEQRLRLRDPIIVGEDGVDFTAACSGDSECFRPKVHVISDGGRRVYTVNNVSGDVLYLNEHLATDVSEGDEVLTVHSPRYSDRIRSWGCDTQYTTYVYSIQMLSLTGQRRPYNPADRHRGTDFEPGRTSDELMVETGMFVTLYNSTPVQPLCPDKLSGADRKPANRYRESGWDDWKLFHKAQVEKCWNKTDPLDVCVASHEESTPGREVCPELMPPTLVSSFEYHMPVNNKWQTKFRIYDRNTINDPEYLIDLNIDLHFPYDASNRRAEQKFVVNQPDEGDFYYDDTKDSTQYSFFPGQTGYRGRPANRVMGEFIPARNPVLNLDVMLQTAKYAAQDILDAQNEGGARNWPWQDEEAINRLVERFDPLKIDFDLEAIDGQQSTLRGLELHPGFEYAVEAFVSVEPLVEEDTHVVYGWSSRVVRKMEYKTELGAEESNLARVRLTVAFNPTAMTSILSSTYSLYQAAIDVGSSVLYCSLALLVLRRFRRITSWRIYLPSRDGRQPPASVSAITSKALELKSN